MALYCKARDEIRTIIKTKVAAKRAEITKLAGVLTPEQKDLAATAAAAAFKGIPLQQSTGMAAHLSAAKRKAAVAEALSMMYSGLHKLVVFCWYKETAAEIAKGLKAEGIQIDGPVHSGVSKKRRDQLARRFADGPKQINRVFIATMGTSAVAMNELCVAPAALFVDLYWVPALLMQAEGRVHRFGQLADNCYIRYLLADGSIDDFMFAHLERKARAIAKIAEDPSAASLCDTLGGANANKQASQEALMQALMTEEW
jgi:SNF2 family DNA or RNA helicase